MTESICKCHCGTRIDLDEQLLEERETWKQKYLCLQKQVKIDIDMMKENIYAECSNLMQQQFSTRESDHNKIVNQKNIEIKDLISKIIGLQTRIKILEKEKQLAEYRVRELEAQSQAKQSEIKRISSRSEKVEREWQIRMEENLNSLRKRLGNGAKEEIEKVENQRDVLKIKVKQFEAKYQKIIPEVEKLKNAIQAKCAQLQENQMACEKMRKQYDQKLRNLAEKLEDVQKMHSMCPKHIRTLEKVKEELETEIQKYKKINREVRVEPVYIDRPVEVEKVIEKVIQVEKVVKKFVENPNSEQINQLQNENKKLKGELNHILVQIKEMQEYYTKIISELEENIKQHEQNTLKYKRQRQNLAYKISEQNKQINMLEEFINRFSDQKGQKNHDGEKIVVHVKKDGTYDKRVQKIPSQTQLKKKK